MSRQLYEQRSTVGCSMTQQGGEDAFKSGLSFFSSITAPCVLAGIEWHYSGNLTAVTITNVYFKLLRDLSVKTGNAELWGFLADTYPCISIRMSHWSILFLYIILSVFIFTNLLLDTVYFLDRHLPPSCTWHISMWNMHLWYSVAVIDHIAAHIHALIPNHIFMASASKLPLLGRGITFSFTQRFPVLKITMCCNQVASCRWLADRGESYPAFWSDSISHHEEMSQTQTALELQHGLVNCVASWKWGDKANVE